VSPTARAAVCREYNFNRQFEEWAQGLGDLLTRYALG
jgi:hypothetical protein